MKRTHVEKYRLNIRDFELGHTYIGSKWNTLFMVRQLHELNGVHHFGKHFLSALLF